MKSMFYLIAIIIYIDFLCAMKITKLENNNDISNTTSIEFPGYNITQITNALKKCNIKYCLRCDPDLIDTCVECNKDFELYDDKCLRKEKLNQFIRAIRENLESPEEQKLIDFVTDEKFLKNSGRNGLDEFNSEKEAGYLSDKFESIEKKFSKASEVLKEVGILNERECRLRINQFTIDFQKNMELLSSLSNFFEQKTIYEIEKTKNGVLDILNFDNGDPRSKLNSVIEKIDAIIKMISDIFGNIKSKINEYEETSVKKIIRMKSSYKIYLRKFLE